EWLKYFEQKKCLVFGVNSHNKDNIKELLNFLQARVRELPKIGHGDQTITLMLFGIPNVGKSALANSLHQIGRISAAEKGRLKHAVASPHPGETKNISGLKIASHPSIYVLDTPGVFPAEILDAEDFIVNKVRRMLYEAVSSFNGDLEDKETMSQLIKAEFAALRDAFNLPPDSDDCVRKVAAKLLNLYRTGRLGHYTLDITHEIIERIYWKGSTMIGRCLSVQASSPNELKFQTLSGIQHLAESRRFKAWFLDQFGVLHDGKQPYPGAISALEKLATCGAKMVIVSNSSRRASITMEKLRSLGFDPSLFVGAITSGELTHQYLQRRGDAWFASLGRSCIHMTWSDRGAISLEGLGLQVVETVEEADFILAHGTEALGLSSGAALPMKLDELEKILDQCAAKKIPMVVANPDFVTVEARALRVMPGTLAATYEKLGGEVKWMGKPDKIIYKSAMEMAAVDASDCIAIGDSLHHDIKGANAARIASAFITGGIHAPELGLGKFGEVADDDSVHALALKNDAYPTYVLPSFTW
ncbi:DAR GTPase 2, mitochondrial, partial [Capsicum chinense]